MSRPTIAVLIFLGCLAISGCGSSECPGGFIDLGGSCYDLQNDPLNCGGFGNACPPGQICDQGRCLLTCPEGMEQCAGVCRNLMRDDYNCGMCGVTCTTGTVCVDGICTPDCPDGYSSCSGTCKNLDNDPSNCGECDHACASGEVCSSGTCSFTCPGGYTDCSGSCADLLTDHEHCGTCDSPCLSGQICSMGSCENSCYEGLTRCSGACRDLMRDHDNCGSCGSTCGTDEVCYDGSCTTSCPGGFTDCTGSCRDLLSDRMNCGACETVCGPGQNCNAGTCETTCPTYLTNCSGVCTDLTMDPENCGSCGTVCALREGCVSGTCLPVIIVGPSLTDVTTTTATMDTYMSTSPYTDKHDGGMVYSISENAIYAIYGNDSSGQRVYRIDHIAGTSALVATLTYGRHGSHPVIDETGGYIYFPPSQNTEQLERMTIGGSHTVVTLTAAPSRGTFAHGTWKNGELWIVLDNYNLYRYDPVGDTWTMVRSYGNRSMVVAHRNDASDNIYVWTVGGNFAAYDTVAGTNTSLASFPVTASLGGNGQIEYIPSAEGLSMGFIYAVSGCSGSPRIYSILADTWYTLSDPHDNGSCNGHCTYDELLMRLYVTDASDQVWYYQY